MTPPFTLAEIRQVLPDLRVRSHIYSGGQKHVYRCAFEGTDAVLKLIQRTPDAEARAHREVETMKLACSPNLVRVLSEGLRSARIRAVSYVYFIEEYIQGRDLFELMGQRWSYPRVTRLMRDLVSAVKALWGRRVVHRDIKPRNIRVRPNGQTVLLDVGLARLVDRSTLTFPLAVPGTYGYHSPEQLRWYRRNLDFRSDLFLIGVCVYELIAKRNPFTEGVTTFEEYQNRVLGGAPTHIKDLDANIPPSLAHLIMRLLQPYANLRPGSFVAIESVLRKVEEEI